MGSEVVVPRLQSTGPMAVAQGLSFSSASGIFPDQGSNRCPLHWQMDSLQWATREAPSTFNFAVLTSAFFGRLSRTAKENQIDLWISAITHVRFLASAEPQQILSLVSQSASFAHLSWCLYLHVLFFSWNIFLKSSSSDKPQSSFKTGWNVTWIYEALQLAPFFLASSPGPSPSLATVFLLHAFSVSQVALLLVLKPFSPTCSFWRPCPCFIHFLVQWRAGGGGGMVDISLGLLSKPMPLNRLLVSKCGLLGKPESLSSWHLSQISICL